MHNLDPKPPAACARIRAALAARGREPDVAPRLGEMIRVLAASKASGTFLSLGEGAGEVGAWILDGMDLSSGLVALVQDREEASVLEEELGQDLRVSVHRQDAEAFLVDVRAHRFDLIVDRIAGEHSGILRLGLAQLRSAGLYVACDLHDPLHTAFAPNAKPSHPQAPPLRPEEFAVAPLDDARGVSIIVRRALPPAKRRRRA
ncbi:MAG: hypothetical protein OEM49_02615 [Myxococcales bacterium]|nr:hypothetical protein [Myxococcales bacterium]MDH5307819.1 hypothetical protein [Myxococcales bacterium]MDH5565585.1 hypothetical protein [Myxococcales bacterium]